MTDELSIQQKRPSAAPYFVTGAALGGIGGAVAAHKIDAARKLVSEPAKYNSYEAILAESEDQFTKAVNEATGEEKTLMEKAAEARRAGADAKAQWNKDFKAFQEAYKPGELAPLAEDHEAMKAFNDKRKQLIDKEVERLKNAATQPNQQTINAVQPKIDTLVTELETASKTFNETVTNQATARYNSVSEISRMQGEISDMRKQLGEVLSSKGKNSNEYKELLKNIENTEKNLKQTQKTLGSLVKKQEETINTEIQKLVKSKAITKAEGEILLADAREAISSQIAVLEHQNASVSNYAFTEMKSTAEKALNSYKDNMSNGNNGIKNNLEAFLKEPTSTELQQKVQNGIIKPEKARLEKLKKWQGEFEKFLESKKPQEVEQIFKVRAKGSNRLTNWFAQLFELEISSSSPELKSAFENLTEADKKLLEKLVGENPTREGFADAIKKLERQVNTLESSVTNLTGLQAEMEKVAGKGAYLKDGKLYNKAGEEIVRKMEVPKGLQTSVTIPESRNLTGLRKTLEKAKGTAGMAENEIAEQAARNIDSKAGELLKAEKDAINKAREALGKNPEKTAEELKAMFEKQHGTEKQAVEKATSKFKDSVKKLFEGKTSNWKLGAGIAATAVAGALIGLAFRPGDKQA